MHQTVQSVLILLSLAALVAIGVRRVKVPYSTALLICGLVAGRLHLVPGIGLEPSIVSYVFLPTLLFQAAVTTDVTPLLGIWRTLGFLVVAGVPLTVLVAGALAHYLLSLPWSVALLFAAVAAPADTVAVVSILRELRVPARLAALIEGESLFISGTALLLVSTILGVALRPAENVDPAVLVARFAWLALGGALFGAALGYGVARMMNAVKDHLVEVLLTSILAYGSYVVAEQIHLSGSIAVVAAGLVVGNYGLRHTISPTTQLTLMGFWSYSAFVVISLLFLICGLEVPLERVAVVAGPVALAFLALHAGRGLAVALCPLVARIAGEPKVPLSWMPVLVWGDFYGSLSVALALALPHEVPGREIVVTVTFGVVLLSLILQGVTLRWLVGGLKLAETPGYMVEFDTCYGRMVAARGAQEELKRLHGQGLISREVYTHLRSRYQVKASRTERQLKQLYETNRELEDREYQAVAAQMLRLERSLITNAIRDRLLSEEAGLALLTEIDEALARAEG
ncbi:MAG: sodium:proton antiporter [Candidatus Wallbacteria bacterium]|nr:sodium:proton antiporter [Candidatus Wallbacteria bacterium]